MSRIDPGKPPAPSRDEGVSLVEVLVAMGLFAVLGTLLLGLALSTSKVTEDTRDLSSVSEQSRLAMERMTRELRQAGRPRGGLPRTPRASFPNDETAIKFWTDFDGDKVQDDSAADPEVMTYRWSPATSELTLTANDPSGAAVTRPMLAVNVTRFVLGLRSSNWQYDTSPPPDENSTTWEELDSAGAPVGNNDGIANGPELKNIDLLSIGLTVHGQPGSTVTHSQTYNTQVDLRNQE